jgi:hypothetical protein
MHSGKSYRLSEFLVWTRQNIFWLFIPGVAPTLVYQVAGIKWIAIPWTVVALLGTATAFIGDSKIRKRITAPGMRGKSGAPSLLTGTKKWDRFVRINDLMQLICAPHYEQT